jgi:HAD superfamily hydrolase (TIGR01459 family)
VVRRGLPLDCGQGRRSARAMTGMHFSIPILSSVAALAGESDAWICDVWGVLHNSVNAFGAASDACRRFRGLGGVVVLLSNAPRPAAIVQKHLDGLGVPRDAYDAIVTSGDLTRTLVHERRSEPLFHLGPGRDVPLFEGLGVRLTDANHARLVVCTGLFDDEHETAEDYATMLGALAARNVPMICANPDVTVERGERLVYCAGALAEAYQRLGGSVTYAGKPHLPVYALVIEQIAKLKGHAVPKSRMLAIGDGIQTDIRGAANVGVRSIFIASAIHVDRPLDGATLTRLFEGSDARPIAAMPALAW